MYDTGTLGGGASSATAINASGHGAGRLANLPTKVPADLDAIRPALSVKAV